MSNNRQASGHRLVKNTLFLYFRMLMLMAVTFYTSRVVLKTLGVEDYGIYNVVGGLVTMFGIVSGALSAAVSRFLNIEMGKNNYSRLKLVFSSSVLIHIIIAIIICIVAESFGPWFIRNKMTIPEERIGAAQFVFQCSLLVLVINLISIPYNACIVAHENMKVYSYVSILEASLKLAIVFVLFLFETDKLILYGFLTLCVAVIIRFIYQYYCNKHYAESHISFVLNKQIIKELFGFASWNMIGSTSVIIADQGVNVLINIFCGPVVNAARGLAMQINTAIIQFSNSFITAINPQITQNYGAKDEKKYIELILNGSKYSSILLSVIILPLLLNTNYVLHLWLHDVPEHTLFFTKLALMFAFCESFSYTFTTGLLATGHIKKLMMLVAGTRMMNFPISWLFLYFTASPEVTMIISCALSIVCFFFRLFLQKQIVNYSISRFIIKTVFPIIVCFSFSLFGAYYMFSLFQWHNVFSFVLISVFVDFLFILLCYILLLTKNERTLITRYIIQKNVYDKISH